MGSTDVPRFSDIIYPKIRTIITNDFFIDKYEVTQDDFERVKGYNPAYYQGKKCGGQCPVESITRDESVAYCTAIGKRLPTAAEWEYAAKGGSLTRHYWGNEIDVKYLWYKNNSGGRPKPVGKKSPNNYGLYDMEGNVFEYVQDCNSYYLENDLFSQIFVYDDYYTALEVDPLYTESDCEQRLIKGSSFAFEGKEAAPHVSYLQNVNDRRGDRGFRCVMNVYGKHCE